MNSAVRPGHFWGTAAAARVMTACWSAAVEKANETFTPLLIPAAGAWVPVVPGAHAMATAPAETAPRIDRRLRRVFIWFMLLRSLGRIVLRDAGPHGLTHRIYPRSRGDDAHNGDVQAPR